MDKKIILKNSCIVLCIGLILFMQSANAFAKPSMGRSRGPHKGPEHIVFAHHRYSYHNGRFYRPTFFGLFNIVIDIPPIGAIFTVLPFGHKTIIVGGVTYYHHDNVYFRSCPYGYIVVEKPVQDIVVVSSESVCQGETVTINVPNSNGSYTPVVLIKQKDGYIGPQGEYYPGHPTVEQLMVLYGK